MISQKDTNLIVNTSEATNELITVLDMIRWGVSKFNQSELFYGHGTDNAWDESVNLVLSLLHLPPDIDSQVLLARLTESERVHVAEKIKARVEKRIPVPYLTNEVWFAGLCFYIDERAIIPRSPIAELIEEEFSPWIEEGSVGSVLDLCTGSGCIAISAAGIFPDAEIDAVDISEDALDVAKINVERFEVEDSVRLIQSNLFENLEKKQYDIIISNPPYVDSAAYNALPEEYHHEPQIALEVGKDGLDTVVSILKQAGEYLAPTGVIVIEVGYLQEALEKRFPNIPFTWLQFENGGEGVFLLTANELKEFKALL